MNIIFSGIMTDIPVSLDETKEKHDLEKKLEMSDSLFSKQ